MKRRSTYERPRRPYPAPGLFVGILTACAIVWAIVGWIYVQEWLG